MNPLDLDGLKSAHSKWKVISSLIIFNGGVAKSAYQIEGAWNEDGKGESIWDRYTHQSQHILNNDTGDTACDHYHRMSKDIKLLSELGVKSYRFSIAWSRVLPNGSGVVNQNGLDF